MGSPGFVLAESVGVSDPIARGDGEIETWKWLAIFVNESPCLTR